MNKPSNTITENDKAAAISKLKPIIDADKRDELTHRTFHLIRYFFHSLNHLECRIAGTKSRVGLEIPFNGLFLSGLSRVKDRLEENILGETKEDLEGKVASCGDSGEKALGLLLHIKYAKKFLEAVLEYEKSYHFSKKEDNESQIVWIKAKIKLEKMFLRDFLAEIDMKKLDKNQLDENIEEFTRDARYPDDFYVKTLAAVYDDFPATPGAGGIAFAVEHP